MGIECIKLEIIPPFQIATGFQHVQDCIEFVGWVAERRYFQRLLPVLELHRCY